MQKVKIFKSHGLDFLETDINSWSANTSIQNYSSRRFKN